MSRCGSGASLGAGSYAHTYDARGQLTNESVVLNSTTYPLSFGYNDAGMATTTTYSDGEVATAGYTAQGWPSSLATVLNSVQTNILTALAYTGVGGAAGRPTAATVANGTYSYSATYDPNLRVTDLQLTHNGTTDFAQSRAYDNVGNVQGLVTTLPAGTDNQILCDDEQNRLVTATSAAGNQTCGTNSAGTLGGGVYTSTYAYDARNRLTGVGGSGAASFSFGSGLPGTAPLDGVTASGSASYTYDAAGDRTNAGQTTGDVYDAERRLVSWNVSGGSGKEAYDGEGHRVAHSTTSGVTTTTTYYVGGLEEVDAASGAVTKYYATPAGVPAALRVGTGGVTYLATDGLGSVSEALDGSGNVTATALYGPYGQTRYSTGTLPTTKGYTGQRLDAASGLYYYQARYYDPATDQFVSADSAAAGLNRYAYVAGNPETATDPTGHRMCDDSDPRCGGGGGGGTLPQVVIANTGNTSAMWPDNAVIDKSKGTVKVGQGQRVPGTTSEYQWCTQDHTCVSATGYSGKDLAALIQSDRDQIKSDTQVLDLLNKWGPLLASGAAFVVGLVAGIIAGLVTKNPGVGLSVFKDVTTWTAFALLAILPVVTNGLQSQIATDTKDAAFLQRAYDAHETVWDVTANDDSSLSAVVVGKGTAPGDAVKQQVASFLWDECTMGVGLLGHWTSC